MADGSGTRFRDEGLVFKGLMGAFGSGGLGFRVLGTCFFGFCRLQGSGWASRVPTLVAAFVG